MPFIDPRRSHTIFERQTSNLSDLLAIDVTGSGSRILSLDEGGTLRLEAVNGSVIAESHLAFDFSEPTVATSSTGEITVVLSSPTALHLFGPTLKPLAEIPVDLEKSLWLEAAASVPCGAKQGTCLASLFKGRGGWHRTVLFLHAPSGELLHHEILKDDYMSVLGLPAVTGEGWGFWVGGRGEVVEYRWR